MNTMNEFFNSFIGFDSDVYMKIFLSLVIILSLWFVRFIIVRIIVHHTEDAHIRYIWRKTTKYLSFVLSILLISRLWIEGIQDITTFLGLLSAGIAIALKDIFTNIAGWLFLIWVRPLGTGDRIQIGTHSGDVIDIGIFHITLMEIGNWVQSDQSTGRIIKIPNGMIFSETLANYSQGFQYIWNEIPVMVTFESNWREAKKILLEISQKYTEKFSAEAEKHVKEASKRLLVFYSKLTPNVYTSVSDSGVLLTIRYLCKPRSRRNTEEVIWEDILHAFTESDDIDFAYPTRRFFYNATEGKPGFKPPASDVIP